MFAATIGFFDGVHRGHRCLIEQLKTIASERRLDTLIVTMKQHPRAVIQSEYVPHLLTTAEEKVRLLEETGVTRIDIIPFDKDTASLTALEFMERVLKPKGVSILLMGYDHRFGHGEAAFEDYVRWGQQCGIEVVRAHELEGQHVSSTAIRTLLSQGRVEEAAALLGHAYLLSGKVVEGYHVGHQLGFPTANIFITPEKVMPRRGVYAVRTNHGPGMLNIGTRPTAANGDDVSVEVHLIDFSGDLYGQQLSLELLTFIREERAFDSLQQLREQLQRDREFVLNLK
jgi:riboflavin kinase/FMN adenylyltransferase